MILSSRRNQFSRIFICVLFLVTTLISCTTSPERNRGSLSDAMGKARDDSTKPRTVPNPRRDPEPRRDPFPETSDDQDTGAPIFLPAFDGGNGNIVFGVRGGGELYSDTSIKTYFDADIFIGASISRCVEVDLFAGLKGAYPEKNSSLDASVKDPIVFLKAGLESRYVPFPDLAFFCPYVSAGIGIHSMFWSFENALTAGSETIASDSLAGIILTSGIGIYPVNSHKFRVGISINPELYVFGAVTNQGFNNDYFNGFGSIRVSAETTVKY